MSAMIWIWDATPQGLYVENLCSIFKCGVSLKGLGHRGMPLGTVSCLQSPLPILDATQ